MNAEQSAVFLAAIFYFLLRLIPEEAHTSSQAQPERPHRSGGLSWVNRTSESLALPGLRDRNGKGRQ